MRNKIIGIILLLSAFALWTFIWLSRMNNIILNTIAIALTLFGADYFREGKQETQDTLEEKLKKDQRKPVLWLRSFDRDYIGIKWSFFSLRTITRNLFLHPDFYNKGAFTDYSTFEGELVNRIDKIGPVVALGRPGEKLPPLGASRAYVAHTDWKEEIKSLIIKSQKIVLILDFSKSVIWELNEIFQNGQLKNLTIVIPDNHTNWQTGYAELSNQFSFLPKVLPENAIAIGFKDNWTNRILTLPDIETGTLSKIKLLHNFIETGTHKPSKSRQKTILIKNIIKCTILALIIGFFLYEQYKKSENAAAGERNNRELQNSLNSNPPATEPDK